MVASFLLMKLAQTTVISLETMKRVMISSGTSLVSNQRLLGSLIRLDTQQRMLRFLKISEWSKSSLPGSMWKRKRRWRNLKICNLSGSLSSNQVLKNPFMLASSAILSLITITLPKVSHRSSTKAARILIMAKLTSTHRSGWITSTNSSMLIEVPIFWSYGATTSPTSHCLLTKIWTRWWKMSG